MPSDDSKTSGHRSLERSLDTLIRSEKEIDAELNAAVTQLKASLTDQPLIVDSMATSGPAIVSTEPVDPRGQVGPGHQAGPGHQIGPGHQVGPVHQVGPGHQSGQGGQLGLEAFDNTTHPTNALAAEGQNNLTAFDSQWLIETVSKMNRCPKRSLAMEALVDGVLASSKSLHLRLAAGDAKVKLVLDSRLGWLPLDNEISLRCQADWNQTAEEFQKRSESLDQNEQADQSEPNEKGETGDHRFYHWVDLNDPATHRRCRLFLANDDVSTQKDIGEKDTGQAAPGSTNSNDHQLAQIVRALNDWATPLSIALWSRPRFSLTLLEASLSARVKKIAVVAIIVLATVLLWPTAYPISADAIVDTLEARVVTTPFDAKLQTVAVLPGDFVKKDQLLLEFDGRPLRLELESLRSELQQAQKEHEVALASREIAEAQQLKLRQKKLERKIELLADRLEQLVVVSPIDGVVVSGDLRKYRGVPMERGQNLVEIASLDQLCIEIDIPEAEIGFAMEGQRAKLQWNALVGQSMEIKLQRISPSASIREEKNVFISQTEIGNQQEVLRPGMKGRATVYGPLRPRIWSYLRPVYEKARWWIGC